MAKMSESEVPSLLLAAQSSAPPLPSAGDLRLYFDLSTSALRSIDGDGVVRTVGAVQIWGPISNGNPDSPTICNAAGGILLSRRE